MGLFRKIFAPKDSQEFGESWFTTFYEGYQKAVKSNPLDSSDYHLLVTWASHFSRRSNHNQHLMLPQVIKAAIVPHACIPAPDCGRALCIYMLLIEQPQVIQVQPVFSRTYESLMHEINALQERKDYDELNRRFKQCNPTSSAFDPFPLVKDDRLREMIDNMRDD